MQLLTSQPIVQSLHELTRERVSTLLDQGIEPHLAAVLVGNNPDSLRYLEIKTRQAKELGIILSLYVLEEESSIDEIKQTLDFLNADSEVHGIILQLPLPATFSAEQVNQLLKMIDEQKDVDGLSGKWQSLTYSGYSMEQLLKPQLLALPPMVCSVSSLLDYYHFPLEGQKIVIVGQGRLVGAPLAWFYQSLGFELTTVNEETTDIISITKQADVLICGTGEPDLITYQWVKEGAVVIDCAKDVHLDSVSQVAQAVSPAIGGIGPLTTAWLLHNTVQAAANHPRHE